MINGAEAMRVQSGGETVAASTRPATQNQSIAAVVAPPQHKQTAPPEGSVTTQSKSPIVVYGTLLWNSFL